MRRFLFLAAVIFGLFLTFHTIRITVREKDMAKVNVKQFKSSIFTVSSPDLFAERNIMDTFEKRYGVKLKFKFKNDLSGYLNFSEDADAVIYPSFAFEKLWQSKVLKPIDTAKVQNIKTLMEDTKADLKEKYTKENAVYAIPIAYIPYALFFSKTQLKESTSAKEIIAIAPSIALADNYATLLTFFKIYKLPINENSVATIKKMLKGKTITYFNPDDPISMTKVLGDAKPKLIIAPSYSKNILERDFGGFEMILPSEGTYADYYLVSLLKSDDVVLSHVFLNHLTEPLIHRNLAEVMGMGITNYASMSDITPVLYNGLKMNNAKYLKEMLTLKNEKDYLTVSKLFEKIK
ncbi:MAG: hypothetical protein OHK0040_08620 [bacterium]